MVKYKINKFYFVKNQVYFAILLILGFSFLVYLFPFNSVHAAKVESGVTINAPSTTETEKICNDGIDNDNDGKIDANDQDCAAPAATATCGLQIMSGSPINYGQLNVGQVSVEQKVTLRNAGTAPAKVMVKAGDWIGGTSATPIKLYGPEITRVAFTPGMECATKFPLHSSEA